MLTSLMCSTTCMRTMCPSATGSSPTSSTPTRPRGVGHRRCRIAGIHASHHRKRSKPGSTGPAPHDDLLAVVGERGVVRHEFAADGPNKGLALGHLGTPDTGRQALHLHDHRCLVEQDRRLFHRHPHEVIPGAIALRLPNGTICRSDRGGQFRAKRTQNLLKNNGLIGSMGRSYGAGDNASMESFFSLLQKNVLNTRGWDSREELRLAMVIWIETKYNRRRRQRGLGILTPHRV